MGKSTVMLTVDRNPVNSCVTVDYDLERLMGLNWAATMTFFAPILVVLKVIANNAVLLRTNAEVKHHVVSWLQCGATLNIYLKPEDSKSVFHIVYSLQLLIKLLITIYDSSLLIRLCKIDFLPI